MHGRIYDPVLAQFLSPDPYMPSVVGHGLNAFAYVNNQPLDFVDPSGFVDMGVSTYTHGGDTAYGFSPDPLYGTTPGLPQGSMGTEATAASFQEGSLSAAEGVIGVAGVAIQIAELATRAPNPHKSQGVPGPRGPQARGSSVPRAPTNNPINPARLDPGHTTWQPGDIGPPPPPDSDLGRPVPGAADAADAHAPGTAVPNSTLSNNAFQVPDTSEDWRRAMEVLMAVTPFGPEDALGGLGVHVVEELAAKGAEAIVTFGRNANQIEHAFRHIDQLGLPREAVKKAIEEHLPSVVDKIPNGKPLNQVIEVGGKRIQYSAFRLPDGTINVGRIHGVP
jgi:hypothetical protein